jgi:hypothetical protein
VTGCGLPGEPDLVPGQGAEEAPSSDRHQHRVLTASVEMGDRTIGDRRFAGIVGSQVGVDGKTLVVVLPSTRR